MSRYEDILREAQASKSAASPTRAEMIFEQRPQIVGTAAIPENPKKQNKLEAQYDNYLKALKDAGVVHNYWYGCVSFKIGENCRYHTDFFVQYPDGHCEIHETKGFMRDDAQVKLKVVAATFPFPLKLVKRVKGEWEFKTYETW